MWRGQGLPLGIRMWVAQKGVPWEQAYSEVTGNVRVGGGIFLEGRGGSSQPTQNWSAVDWQETLTPIAPKAGSGSFSASVLALRFALPPAVLTWVTARTQPLQPTAWELPRERSCEAAFLDPNECRELTSSRLKGQLGLCDQSQFQAEVMESSPSHSFSNYSYIFDRFKNRMAD